MIDSHCHLSDTKFAEDLDAVIRRAGEAGVEMMVTIADSLEEGQKCIAVAEKYPNVFCTVGAHPHTSSMWEAGSGQKLRAMAASSVRIKAIGEIGLDYHYDFSPRDVQQAVFREQLQIAKELKLPVVVHCREAAEDAWRIVDEIKPETLVLHCCTEKWEDVERFVGRGDFLSFTGIVTYPKSDVVRRTIEKCPIDRLMIETDAPYLAPVPHRGKRNEPAFVAEVAKVVAAIKGISFEEVDAATTRNTVEFFRLPS